MLHKTAECLNEKIRMHLLKMETAVPMRQKTLWSCSLTDVMHILHSRRKKKVWTEKQSKINPTSLSLLGVSAAEVKNVKIAGNIQGKSVLDAHTHTKLQTHVIIFHFIF